MKREPRWLLLFVLLLALGSPACGLLSSGGEPPAPAEAQPPAEQPVEAQPPAEEPVAAPTEAPAETDAGVETEDTFSLQSVSETLSDLSSYRTLTTLRAHDGSTVSVAGSFSSDPAAHIQEVEFSGVSSIPGAASTTVATIAGVSYSIVQGTCVAVPAELAWLETENPLLELGDPDTIVGGIAGARRVMPNQVVNGVEARHYVFDRVTAQSTHFEFNTVAGELFIAEEGDYVVRYTIEAQGQSGLLGAAGQQQDTVQVSFDVTDVNQPLNIAPPAECAAATLPGETTVPGLGDGSLPGLPLVGGTPPSETDWIWADDEDEEPAASPGTGESGGQAAPPPPPATTTLPRLPDAYNLVTSATGNETYHTNHSFEDAVAFYRQEMAARGWAIYNEMPTPISQTMDFTRSGANLRVTITRDPNWNYTSVIVNWP